MGRGGKAPIRAISLFSGAGGMDIGFSQAGFTVLAAIEKDPACCDTLRTNLGDNTEVLNEDINDVTGAHLLKRFGLKRGELDLVFGGPPCQSFSLAGNRQGLNDPRGKMVAEYVRLVRELLPKAFVLENVKGLINWEGGKALELILEEMGKPIIFKGKKYTYQCADKVLNAADYGVPQFRERLFIVGNRLGRDFQFPDPTHGVATAHTPPRVLKPYLTVANAIGDLPAATQPSETALRVSQTIKGRIEKHGY